MLVAVKIIFFGHPLMTIICDLHWICLQQDNVLVTVLCLNHQSKMCVVVFMYYLLAAL